MIPLSQKAVDCSLWVVFVDRLSVHPSIGTIAPSQGLQVSQGLVHKWQEDGQVVCGSAVPDCCGGLERAEPHGKALDLPFCRGPDPHLRSWALGSEQNDEVVE